MMKTRKIEETFFKVISGVITLFIVLLLCYIIGIIVFKGMKYMSWEIISTVPKGGYYFGREGGILNAIIGSLYLALGATILAFVMSLPIALFINIYLVRNPQIRISVRFAMDVLWGVPSIVYGSFGFLLMLFIGIKASLLAGIITVALMITPVMVRAMDEVLRFIPAGLLEAAYSLGATKTEAGFQIFLKQAIPGFLTAILLSFGRAVGDAASVLFTAGYTDHIPQRLSDPTATLPLAIFFQLSSPIPEVQGRAFAAALILTVLILIISISSRLAFKPKR